MPTYTANKHIETPINGSYVNNWDVPVNANWQSIDLAFGGVTNLGVTTVSGTVVLTSTQYQPLILSITGILTANVNYQIPSAVGGQWIVANRTTGSYTVTISSGGGGTSVVVPQGYNSVVASDGTNIALANSAPATAAGSNTQIQYNASGVFGASANLTFDGTTFTVTGNEIVTGTLGVTGAASLSSTLGVTGAITGNSTITGTALIPSGSSVPTNGVYLPAANTVGVSSNTTERLRIDSTGAWGLAGANYGTSGQVLTSAGSGSPPTWATPAGPINVQTFTASGTWTKPSGYAAGSRVFVQAWGGGGSGGKGSTKTGGGGGGYNERWLLLSDMGATETITVGTGGAAVTASNTDGNNGNNTTVGSLVTAYGGSGTGGGGGQLSAGSGTKGGQPYFLAVVDNVASTVTGMKNQNQGDIGLTQGDGSTISGAPSTFMHGGGGAGGSSGYTAGNSLWAGGGGGSSSSTVAGTSKYGGAGGTGGTSGSGTAGSQPGGGGGGTNSGTSSGKGGDGKVIITVFAA